MRGEKFLLEAIQKSNQDRYITPLKRYAVMMLFYEEKGAWYTIYEKRSGRISQPFEISFPGGKMEPGETAIEAALRETREEIGLSEDKIKVLGTLPPFIGAESFEIIPVIGFLPHFEVEFLDIHQSEEVADCFLESVAFLKAQQPKVGKIGYQVTLDEDFPIEHLPGKGDYPWKTKIREVFFYTLSNKEILWGLTAEITKYFLDLFREEPNT